MRFVLNFIFILFLSSSDRFLFAQSNILKLERVNLSGWFTLLVPRTNDGFLPHGSVDGGDIDSKEIMVEFHYWQNGNAPLYMKRDSNTVSTSKFQTKSWRILIDGKKAVAQTWFDIKNSEFNYYVTFSRIKVPDEESGKFRYGQFYLTINYKNKLYSSTAQRIAKSLKFKN